MKEQVNTHYFGTILATAPEYRLPKRMQFAYPE